MPYTQPTLTEAQTALSIRLQDPLMVRWTAAELIVYLREALRTWNAWTSHFRDQGSFTLTMLQVFFDLPTELPTLRGYTITNGELIADLQYALLEPAAAFGTWTGTAQFDLATLTSAIQRRRDQFLRETGAVITEFDTAFTATAAGRFELAENIVNVRHADWLVDATGLRVPLGRTDEWAANNFRASWVTPAARPRWFSVSATPPLFVQVMPPPLTDGRLSGLAIQTGATIDPVVSSLLGVPDDWAWVIKFGALADLLQQDGLAIDPQRAAYCESRWQQGVAQATKSPVILAARINEAVAPLASVEDADNFSPLWSLLGQIPRKLVTIGHNIVGSWPPAGGGGPYTALLDVVRNAPVPAIGADILQISQDVYDTILDYAQHLALFKEGPGQVELAIALLNRATTAAGIDLQLQQAAQPSRAPLLGQQNQEQRAQQLQEEAVVVE